MKRVAVDFDGTLVSNLWPAKSYEFMPGAIEAMHAFHDAGIQPFVFTSRIARGPEFPLFPVAKTRGEIQEQINYIRALLDSAGLTFMPIWNEPWKPGAEAYIDDKAVFYAGRRTSWANVTEKVMTKLGVETADV